MFALALLPLIIFLMLLSMVLLCFGKWRCALAALLLAIGVNAYTQQVPLNLRPGFASVCSNTNVKKLRIFEYNVCAKSEFTVLHDKDFINYILDQDADILFLPENRYYTDRKLDSALNEHYPYSIFSQVPEKEWPGELGIYSRFPLKNIKRLKISCDHSKQTYSRLTRYLANWADTLMFAQPNVRYGQKRDSLIGNSLISATALVGGRSIGIIFVHCSSNSNGFEIAYSARRAEADALVKELHTTFADMPYLILAGDLNDVSGSPLLVALQKAGLRDAWWNAGRGLGFTYVNGKLRFRLDHIMVSGTIAVKNVKVDSKAPWSDHRPMVADIELLDF